MRPGWHLQAFATGDWCGREQSGSCVCVVVGGGGGGGGDCGGQGNSLMMILGEN